MKQIIKIEGLDCPNCARALEKEINKISVIEHAKIDFLKGTILIETTNIETAIKEIKKVAKQVEPDAVIIDGENNNNKILMADVVILLIGILVGCFSFVFSHLTILFFVLFILSVLLLGYKTYYKAFTLLIKGTVNENLLLTISVVGAALLGEYMESLMVIGLYSIGKIFEGLALAKSKKSIEDLTDLQVDYVTLMVDNNEKISKPSEVLVNSLIVVKSGERVPIDGIVVDGKATLDMQSLTGESLPFDVSKNSTILSGSIVLDGVLYIKTTCEYKESTASRIMELISKASEHKSKTETLISKVSKWYTLGVMMAALIVFMIVLAITYNMELAIYRGLVFLVVSCPCAFAISVPLAYFSGIGNASRNGILIKGSNYLDACSKLSLIAFDKTGTLTTGDFCIAKVEIRDDYSVEDIIYFASLAEQNSLHPLAKPILEKNVRELDKVEDFKEVAGKGIFYKYKNDNYFVGKQEVICNEQGSIVSVCKNDIEIGKIILADTIKANIVDLSEKLAHLNVEMMILSGDNKASVEEVANKLNVQNVYSNLLPADKYKIIEKKKRDLRGNIGYMGDGLNDAPSLMLADVGITMGISGVDASIEASDIVLVDDDPNKIIKAIKISKYTQKIVWENIVFSAGIKFTFLLLATLGITGMFSAVFADVGVTLLAILNSMRALIYKDK